MHSVLFGLVSQNAGCQLSASRFVGQLRRPSGGSTGSSGSGATGVPAATTCTPQATCTQRSSVTGAPGTRTWKKSPPGALIAIIA